MITGTVIGSDLIGRSLRRPSLLSKTHPKVVNMSVPPDGRSRPASGEGEFVYRADNPSKGGQASPPEFVFFVAPRVNAREAVAEVKNQKPAEESAAGASDRIEEEKRPSEAIEHEALGLPDSQTRRDASLAYPSWEPREFPGFPSKRAEPSVVEEATPRRRLSIIVTAIAVLGVVGVIAGLLFQAPSIHLFGGKPQPSHSASRTQPSRVGDNRSSNSGEPADLRRQDPSVEGNNGGAVVESQPAASSSLQSSEQPRNDTPNGEINPSLAPGLVGESPADAGVPAQAPESQDASPAAADSGGGRPAAFVFSPPLYSGAEKPAPAQPRSDAPQRRESAERQGAGSEHVRRRQQTSRSEELKVIRSRLLQERMQDWWRQAGEMKGSDGAPLNSEARKSRAKETEARIRSEIGALSEADLRRIEAKWKIEDASRRAKQKPASDQTRSPKNVDQ